MSFGPVGDIALITSNSTVTVKFDMSSSPLGSAPSAPLRSVIVDANAAARAGLSKHLRRHRKIKLVGETHTVTTALVFCRTLLPDVLFLDISLPHAETFLLLPVPAGNPRMQIVFLTKPDDRTVEAFEVRSLPYLLKPYSAKRVALMLNQLLRTYVGLAIAPQVVSQAEAASKAIWVITDNGRLKVKLADIVIIKAEAPYSRLTLFDGNTYLLRRAMSQWEALLPEADFIRVDRSQIINLRRLEKLERVSRDRALITLRGLSGSRKLGRKPSLRLMQRLKAASLLK
jgi:DNA-binding LytR/AlgR family response regulator